MNFTPNPSSLTLRWRVLILLAGFSLVSYALRTNISVAAKFMMPELGLSEVQMGQVFSSFMLGYAIFQIPAGFFGDRKGPRLVLTLSALMWGVTTLLTGLIPGMIISSGVAMFISLLVLRFALGAAEASTYPVASRAVANWMPAPERAFANSIVITGTAVGMILTPPLMSWLMVAQGWRAVFYATSILGLLIALVWWYVAADHPEQSAQHAHSQPKSIDKAQLGRTEALTTSMRRLLRNRDLWLICVSYFLDSFVLFIFIFWFFLYLVEERGFSVLKGGIFNSLPYIFAAVLIPLCGRLSDYISAQKGRNLGRRIAAFGCLTISAAFLFVGAQVINPYYAIICLSLSVGFLMSTEGPFWSSAADIAGAQAGTAGGIMNTAGNLGGVISTALAPVSVQHLGWHWTFAGSATLALIAGLIWLFIQVEQPARIAKE